MPRCVSTGAFSCLRVYINKVYRLRKKPFRNENVCFNILYRFFFVVKKNRRIFAASNQISQLSTGTGTSQMPTSFSWAFLMPLHKNGGWRFPQKLRTCQ